LPKKKNGFKIINTINFIKRERKMSTYKVIEIIGTSPTSWEEAAKIAIERAGKSLDDLRVAEVVDQDLKIEDGSVTAYRTKLRLSFKFKDD